jgi:uncharacterized protein (DUF1499 family)
MRDETRAIESSIWTIRIALFCLAIVLLTIIFHRIFGMGTLVALNLFKLSFIGSGVVIVIGVFSLVRIWQRGWRGGSNALTGIVIALAILAWPLSIVPIAERYPRINDITTDLKNPPQFLLLAGKRPAGAKPVAHPGEAVARQQEEGYGRIAPMRVDRPATETLELARQALRKLRMTVEGVVAMDARGNGWGQVEAVDRTLVLGFYDDVVVRVTRIRGGSLVDIRSASRFGQSDLGRNAERIREVKAELAARVQATVPALDAKQDAGRTSSRR